MRRLALLALLLLGCDGERSFEAPVTLAAIKADERFADFPLVTMGRLSAMEVPPDLDKALRAMAGL